MELLIVVAVGAILVVGIVVLVLRKTLVKDDPVPLAAPSGNSNTLAVVAFVLSFFASVPAVVCAHVALGQIRTSGDSGRGFAIAALWIGYIAIGVAVVAGVAAALTLAPR